MYNHVYIYIYALHIVVQDVPSDLGPVWKVKTPPISHPLTSDLQACIDGAKTLETSAKEPRLETKKGCKMLKDAERS